MPSVVTGLEIFWKITPMMGIVFWLGLFWRRTTVSGAWAATITAFTTWFISSRPFFILFVSNVPGSETLRFVVERATGPEIYLPWQMVFYLTTGILAGIIASLLTKPVGKSKLDNFYALIRTPIQPGEVVTKPCTLPEDAVVPPSRNLFPNTNFEIPVPSRTSVIGFLVGWACAAVIVFAVYLIACA